MSSLPAVTNESRIFPEIRDESNPLADPAFWQRAAVYQAMPRPSLTQQTLEKASAMAPLAQQAEEKRGPLGTALHWAGEILDVGNRFVTRPVIGALVKAVSSDPKYDKLSYTQAFNEAFKDHPWLRFGVEVVFDPLNLVGVGLVSKLAKVGKVAKLLETSAKARKAFAAAQLADETIGRIQALPVTVPLAGLKKGAKLLEKATGKPLFAKTPVARARQEVERLREILTGDNLDWLQRWNDTIVLSRQEALNRLKGLPEEQIRDEVKSWDAVSAIQAWDALKDTIDDALDPAKKIVTEELKQRGLLKQLNNGVIVPSERMARHLELEDALVGRELPHQARRALHSILDGIAVAIYLRNPEKYRDLEDVYGLFKIDTKPLDTATSVPQSLFQAAKNAVAKATKTVFGNDTVQRVLDEYEKRGVISPETMRSVSLDDFLKRIGATKEEFDTAMEAIRKGFEALDPYQKDRAVNWYRKWGTFMGATFGNQPIGMDLALELTDPGQARQVTRFIPVTDEEKKQILEVAEQVIKRKPDQKNPITQQEWQRIKAASVK